MVHEPRINQCPSFIFGAGEQANLLIHLMRWIGLQTETIAFFDDSYPQRTVGPTGLPIVGDIATGIERTVRSKEPSLVAVGTRGAAFRYSLFLRLRAEEVPLISLIHPSTLICPGASFGTNVIMFSGCTLASNAQIGSMCTMLTNVTIEHDCTVGDNVFIGPGVVMAGRATVGKHAFIGTGATVGPKSNIGQRALVGAGAVVINDVPAGMVAIGMPAKARRPTVLGDDVPTLEQLSQFGIVDQ